MYATITKQEINIYDGVPSLEAMQKAVGGYICTALRVPSPTRADIAVDVFCNDEGLILGLPINHVRLTDMSPLAGDLIIVGADENTGESVPLTRDEIQAALEHLAPLREPITEYEF